MSSLEKRHTSRRGSMQGHHKYSDGFSDTSSAGSFMDETDREVSNLTDRAFRSLCIGEEAIYNDSEISSPTERHKAFAEDVQQKEVLKTTCQETLSYGIQYGEAERQSEVTSTFQHSYVDVAQEQVLRDEHMSYMSNGSMEAAWQQRRSTSRVSSLIKAFSSREGYCDSGTPDALLLRDKYRDYNNGSWDKSALLSIQRELSELSTYHQNFKSGPFQSYRNHFHASAAAMAQMDTTTSLMTSSKTRFQALNSTNFFFHSEFSPFQLWKDYNRFPFEREEPLGFVSASDFPRWYDSPLYKELTATDTFSSERRFNRRKIEDVVPTQRSRSTVVQKAPAIEKRCESEMASNCPPWKRNNNLVRNKLPSNRPSTVSPTNTKTHRPNSSLLSYSRHTYDTQQKVESMVDTQTSNSSTPFNITQLLTPVIHGRQETETSEILQFSHTPSLPDYSVQGDVDLKSPSEVRQLRDSYKSKASSLLFNLKDNRKRVKSTYTPSKFTSLEITDRTKQPSMLDDLESGFSDTSTSQATTQQHSTESWEAGNVVQQTYEACLTQTGEHQVYADGLHDDMTLASHYGAGNYKVSYGGSQSASLHPDTEYDFSQHLSSAQNKSAGNSDGQIYGLSKKVSPTRPEIENNFPEATTLHPPAHSLSAQVSEKRTFSRRELGHHDFTDRQNVVRKTNYGYTTNLATEENLGWENQEPPTTGIKDSLTFKGEIAALIERDKQRKATAKQYLPSANGSYTTGKENYINKVNEDIKQGRLVKEEEDQDTEGFLQKYPYKNNPVQGNPTNGPSASHLNPYEFQNNAHHKMTPSSLSSSSSLSPPKESSFIGQRNMKYATGNITPEKDNYQKIHSSTSLEEKHQRTEGSVAYQPYKYEPNKQWHIAATENRRNTDNVNIPLQQQPAQTYYAHPILDVSDYQHKNMAYATTRTTQRNLFTKDRAKSVEYKPFDSMAPKLTYQTTYGDTKADINKQNVQNTDPNTNISQAREDKFSINDILSVRDNEQAKRMRENKLNSFPASVSDPTRLDNQAFPGTSAIVEETAPKLDASKVTQDPSYLYKHENANASYGYTRKDSYIQNEGLVNHGAVMKDSSIKSGIEPFIDKESDKIIQKSLSYKERSQTKQEILTSKLKAHAQKEISAIKEKGLAKQGILSRNPAKQNAAVNSTKAQVIQEVLSPKKEITAEKLNHLFQDITYSSVTLQKDRDDPKYEPLTTEEIILPKGAIWPQADVALSEKNNEALKDDKLGKENTNVQPLPQRMQPQDENITAAGKKPSTSEVQNEFTMMSTTAAEPVNESIDREPVPPTKHLTRSPAINPRKKEASKEVVNTKEQTPSILPKTYSVNANTEYPTIAAKEKECLKNVGFKKITPYSPTTYSNSEQVKTLDYSVRKEQEEQFSNAKVDKTTVKSVPIDKKHKDVSETTRPQVESTHHANQSSSAKKEEISATQVKSPSEEALSTSSDNKTGPPTKYKTNSTKEEEKHLSRDAFFNASGASENTNTPETKEKEDLRLATKQDIKRQLDNTSKTPKNEDAVIQNSNSVIQKLQPKPFEIADRNKETLPTPALIKQDKISNNEDSIMQKLQHVDVSKAMPFENEDRNKEQHQTTESNKQDKISKNEDSSGQHLQHVDAPKTKSFEKEDRKKGNHEISELSKQDKISKNEDAVIKKIQHDDTLKVRSFENADRNKGQQQTSDSNKLEKISKNEDSVIKKNQQVDTPKARSIENADKNKGKLQTPESNKQVKISKNEEFVLKKNQQVDTPKAKSFENADRNKEKHQISDSNKQDTLSKNEDSILKKNQHDDTLKVRSFENADRNKGNHQTSESNKQDKLSKNEDSTVQKHQQVDTPKAKSFEKEDRRKEKQQTSDSNKLEKISKNEDSVIQKNQHVSTPKVKPFENADRNKGNHQTSETNKEDKLKSVSAEANGSFLLEELKHRAIDKPHSEKHKKEEIRDLKYPNSPLVKADKVKGSSDIQRQQDNDRPLSREKLIKNKKDFSEQDESPAKEMKQAKDKSKVTKNNSKPTDSIAEKTAEKPNSLNVPLNNADEQMNSQTAQDKCSDIVNPGAESKEEHAPEDEPVIYSIRISSKSDVVSEDEPVIYTICVSSISDSSMTDGPVNQDTHSFGEKQLSSEGAEKEGETSGNQNEETETRLESKASDAEKARASFSSDKAEKETEKEAIRKYDSPATKDKQDYYRSSEVNNISSSYESLLAKYGLSIREKVHHKSEQKEPEKMQEKEKEEFTNNLPTKLPKKPVKDQSSSSESVSADAAERHCQESRKQKLPEETSELLKKGEENGQNITQSKKHNDGLTLEAAGIMNTKDKKQLELQNEPDKQASPKSKVIKTYEDNQETQLTISSKQTKRYDSVELDQTKQVGQKVQTVDLARKIKNKPKENENESVLSKKANTVLMENEKDNQNAEIRSTTVIGNHSSEDTHLPKVSMSVKDNKASSSVVKERFKRNKKGDCEGDVVKPDILTKEHAPTKEDKALQNNKKELGVSENELPVQEQAKFKTINSKTVNETKDRCETGINASGNKQTDRSVQENCSVREDLHKNASTTVKADQNPFKAPNKLLEDPKVNKDQHKLNADISTVQDRRLDQQKQIKTDSMSARDMVLPKLSNSQSATSQKVAGQQPQTITSPTEGIVLPKLSNSQSVMPQKVAEQKPQTIKSPTEGIVLPKLSNSQSVTSQKVAEQKTQTITSPTDSMVLPKLSNSQSVTPQNVAEQKTQTITSPTESGSEFRSQKNKGESIPRQKENVKDDKDNVKDNVYTNVNRDNAKKAHLVKVEKATEGESNKNDSLKERTAQPQVRKDDTLTADKVMKDSGQTKSNVGAVVDKDSSHCIKEKTGNTGEGSQVRHDGHDRVNVYQYHPGKGFLPETKTNTYDEHNCIGTNLHDMVPKKKEVISTKSEAIQKEKKPNRPDISAIADYARLRVISAEDENASEKDLLEKLDTYRKYNSSSVEPQKRLPGNRPILGAEAKRELTLYKSKENESQTAKPLQVHEHERRSFQRSRVTEGVPEGHNQFTPREETVAQAKVFSQAKSSDNRIFAVKESGSTKDKALTNQMPSNTKIPATEQHYEYQRRHELHQSQVPQAKHTLLSKVEGKNDDANIIRQRVHSKMLEKDSRTHVKNQESLPQTSMGSTQASHEVNKQADNKVNALPVSPEINDAEKGDELQYYIVSTMESESKPSNDKISSKKDVPEIETTKPRSNASSPAMGKPIMFRVKDNTMRTSSVTKTVKPRFHRSFSEELKVSSSKDVWSGLEKVEPDLEYHPKELANPPNPQVLHEPVVVSHRLPKAREFQPQNSSSLAEFTAAKDARSYHRRSQGFDDEDGRSVISTLSEDVESIAGSSVVMGDRTGLHELRSNRSTYDRPESSCYERPASSYYERPESACSDIRSMGKPPTVPPKSEKALRRAQKLTTRRIKKAEAKIATDSQEQLETSKPVRAFSSLPSSPMELISTNHAIQASPPISHYHVDPNYAAPAPSLVAHPFPVTQRKLLQDPNSGQYFMVDMPVPHVKMKMFFDPETGKYVQLNVRQRTQSTLSQPQSMEVLNHSYVVYPGFLPMSVSTLPTLRSSSQMSAPATLVEEPNKLEASRETGRQENQRPNCYNNNNAAYGSLEHSGYEEQSLYKQSNVNLTPRHTGIITMSELEDFAMEST